jgi:hypothetical protein
MSACARPDGRQTARSACLHGSIEPIWLSQPSSQAAPSVAFEHVPDDDRGRAPTIPPAAALLRLCYQQSGLVASMDAAVVLARRGSTRELLVEAGQAEHPERALRGHAFGVECLGVLQIAFHKLQQRAVQVVEEADADIAHRVERIEMESNVGGLQRGGARVDAVHIETT